MENFGLDSETGGLIKTFFSGFEEIEKVKIFGSRAKGNYKPNSDIDFAVYGQFDDKFTLHLLSGLDELATSYRFDVVNYNTIENENLKQNIDESGKTFYKKQRR